MAGYCTVEDLATLFDPGDFAQYTEDEEDAQKAIDEEAKFINGYLQTRYTTPVSPAPELLKNFNQRLAVHRLVYRRHKLDMPSYMEKERAEIIRALEKIAAGHFPILPVDEPAYDEGFVSPYAVVKRGGDRRFPPSELDKMNIF